MLVGVVELVVCGMGSGVLFFGLCVCCCGVMVGVWGGVLVVVG